MGYWVLAYYHFTHLEDPIFEVTRHIEFLSKQDIKCRVYLSEQGINGQMSGTIASINAYMKWLSSDSRFADIDFKIHLHDEHCFPRTTVKYRKQLVSLDVPVNLTEERGTYLNPAEWKEMLKNRDENTILIDARNRYESVIGHFKGAVLPPLEQFREFPDYIKVLTEIYPPSKFQVMMYCTGGIRCETFSCLMKREGYRAVYQLKGGVIGYGLKEGSEHWKGKLFVFDDRLSVPIVSNREVEIISHCQFCKTTPSDTYFNCANSTCNELFISCISCARIRKGCCSSLCEEAPHIRQMDTSNKPKPFRRMQPLSS